MKKATRIFTIAALAFGMVMAVSCKKDENGGGNTENLPTTLDENFDNGIPSTWTNIDADADGYKWMPSSQGFQSPCGVDGTECAASASFINGIGELDAENYLVSPKIYIEEGATLTYDVTNFQSQFPDSYSVMIGTVENGAFVSQATIVPAERVSTGYREDNGAFTHRSVDLSPYKGKSVCIAFCHKDYDAYWLLLDNVKVSK